MLDEGNREGLAIKVGTSIPAARVVLVLDHLVALYERPQVLRLDNSPELNKAVHTHLETGEPLKCRKYGIEARCIDTTGNSN